jgi:hypothetical protein
VVSHHSGHAAVAVAVAPPRRMNNADMASPVRPLQYWLSPRTGGLAWASASTVNASVEHCLRFLHHRLPFGVQVTAVIELFARPLRTCLTN